MISPSGLFSYVAVFAQDSFGDGEINVRAQDRTGQRSLTGDNPRIRFWGDQMVLIATDEQRAAVKWFRFRTGDVVARLAEPGDVLELERTGPGQLRLTIVREGQLILAIGAVSGVTFGPDVSVACSDSSPVVRLSSTNQDLELRARDSAQLGGYDIYAERLPEGGHPGRAECLSIVLANDATIVNAARRAATLLDSDDREHFDRLRGEKLDGDYIRF